MQKGITAQKTGSDSQSSPMKLPVLPQEIQSRICHTAMHLEVQEHKALGWWEVHFELERSDIPAWVEQAPARAELECRAVEASRIWSAKQRRLCEENGVTYVLGWSYDDVRH